MIQKMSNEISSRSNRIDVLKGIAILLVILGHAIIGITQSLHGKEMVLHGGVLVLNEVIYSFHMPLFFIVAGIYSEKWAALPIKRAFKSKALRLIYPYFIWSTILAVAMELAKGSTNGGLGLVDLFKSPIVPFSEFWFIYILFFIHILWYLIHKLTGNNFKSRQIFFYIALLPYVLSPILPDFWITERLCKYALFFSIGLFVLPLSLEDKKISFNFFFSIFILFFVC